MTDEMVDDFAGGIESSGKDFLGEKIPHPRGGFIGFRIVGLGLSLPGLEATIRVRRRTGKVWERWEILTLS